MFGRKIERLERPERTTPPKKNFVQISKEALDKFDRLWGDDVYESTKDKTSI